MSGRNTLTHACTGVAQLAPKPHPPGGPRRARGGTEGQEGCGLAPSMRPRAPPCPPRPLALCSCGAFFGSEGKESIIGRVPAQPATGALLYLGPCCGGRSGAPCLGEAPERRPNSRGSEGTRAIGASSEWFVRAQTHLNPGPGRAQSRRVCATKSPALPCALGCANIAVQAKKLVTRSTLCVCARCSVW